MAVTEVCSELSVVPAIPSVAVTLFRARLWSLTTARVRNVCLWCANFFESDLCESSSPVFGKTHLREPTFILLKEFDQSVAPTVARRDFIRYEGEDSKKII